MGSDASSPREIFRSSNEFTGTSSLLSTTGDSSEPLSRLGSGCTTVSVSVFDIGELVSARLCDTGV